MTEREPFPLPPPRRTVPASSPQRTKATPSVWERAKSGTSSTWNELYKVADKVGDWSNNVVGKMGVEAFYPTSLEKECSKAARILRTFTVDAADLPEEALADNRKTQKVIKKIPSSAIENCKGIAIFTVFRTGLVVSGASGAGVVLARLSDGSWTPPSGILLHTIGFGFSGGADVYDVILLLRTDAAVKSFAKPRVTLGAEVSIAAGPIGNGFMLEMGVEASPVWSYVKSKGLYGGAQVDGNIVIERNDENARSYFQSGIKASDILSGHVRLIPAWADDLHQTLRAAEGKSHRPLQSDDSPIEDAPARRLPLEAEDESDLVARREMEQAMAELGEDPSINRRAREADDAEMASSLDEMKIQDSSVDSQVLARNGTPPTLPARRVVPAIPVAPVEVEQAVEVEKVALSPAAGAAGTSEKELQVETVDAAASVEVERVEGEREDKGKEVEAK